jgi:predicted TPR repeat methyltransferase
MSKNTKSEGASIGQMSLEQAIGLAMQKQQSGDLEQAQAIYRSILMVLPNEANALHFLGIAMHQSGNSVGGIELIERSIKLDPQSNRYSNFGNVLLQAGHFEEATRAFSRALELNPTSANAYNNFGVLLKAQKRFDEAVVAFEKALAINPSHANAHSNIGDVFVAQGRFSEAAPYYCKTLSFEPAHIHAKKHLSAAYYALGEIEKAAAIYRQWLAQEPDNPIARHHLAACTGEAIPTRAEDAYIESTFDDFASSFDSQLGQLDYRAPQLLAEVLQRQCGAGSKQFAILDAGCGTGLCGPLIAAHASQLTGVDLSSGMLAKAKLRNVYDVLIKAELSAYLQSKINTFDVILSADTLIYFGALESLFAAARTAMREGGHLFFTLESSINSGSDSKSDRGYCINPHGRYSHSDTYVRHTLKQAGFTSVVLETATLRHETGKPVQGFIVSCRAI